MHKELLKLLEKATGRSEHVIAVNLDIRSFTPFCETEDSLNVATYITRVYLKIINDYFKNISFYKPTGDGLIIIIPYDRENLREVARLTINSCLDLFEKFGSLCDDNHMINYPTPDKIGIGIARGSACCITSEDGSKILDYSGRLLNLTSRLMDIARPSGIVFDDSFGIDLLSDETKELFSEETVYVRGVAEEKPIKIHYTEKHTLIPASYKQPLKEPKWKTDTKNILFKSFKKIKPGYRITLTKKPLDVNKISITISHPSTSLEGFETHHYYSIDADEIEYKHSGNKHWIRINIGAISEILKEKGVTNDMTLRFDVIYPVK